MHVKEVANAQAAPWGVVRILECEPVGSGLKFLKQAWLGRPWPTNEWQSNQVMAERGEQKEGAKPLVQVPEPW